MRIALHLWGLHFSNTLLHSNHDKNIRNIPIKAHCDKYTNNMLIG